LVDFKRVVAVENRLAGRLNGGIVDDFERAGRKQAELAGERGEFVVRPLFTLGKAAEQGGVTGSRALILPSPAVLTSPPVPLSCKQAEGVSGTEAGLASRGDAEPIMSGPPLILLAGEGDGG
jgi:hypothetical protein